MFSFLYKKILKNFEIKYDLDRINPSFHNKMHTIGSMITTVAANLFFKLSPLESGLLSYALWFAWEIGDGFKPWYTEFKYNLSQPKIINWLRQNFLYSDKFSLQDVCVWNLAGTLVGALLVTIIHLNV